jgi:hypothetical protein
MGERSNYGLVFGSEFDPPSRVFGSKSLSQQNSSHHYRTID